MLFTAGENDKRVHPMHARKMAALMQASSASDPQQAPILLWVDRDAGHGAGKPLDLQIRDVADQRHIHDVAAGHAQGQIGGAAGSVVQTLRDRSASVQNGRLNQTIDVRP